MEKRIARLERIVDRLSRRAVKVSTGLITPYPISAAVSGDAVQGDILDYMFPCSGIISKGAIMLGTKPGGDVVVRVELFNRDSGTSNEFTIDSPLKVIKLDLNVRTWDCLKVSLFAHPEHPVTRVWTSFLWTPMLADVDIKRFLIDELERVKEEAQNEGV